MYATRTCSCKKNLCTHGGCKCQVCTPGCGCKGTCWKSRQPVNNFAPQPQVLPVNNFAPLPYALPVNNFAPLPHVLPVNNFAPPVKNFNPQPHSPPVNDFAPPMKNFNPQPHMPPVNNFSPPAKNFAPQHHVPPVNNFALQPHVLPVNNFGPWPQGQSLLQVNNVEALTNTIQGLRLENPSSSSSFETSSSSNDESWDYKWTFTVVDEESDYDDNWPVQAAELFIDIEDILDLGDAEELDEAKLLEDLVCRTDMTFYFTEDRDEVLKRLQTAAADYKLPLVTNDGPHDWEPIYFRDFYYKTRRRAVVIHNSWNNAEEGKWPESFSPFPPTLVPHLESLGFEVSLFQDIPDFTAALTALSESKDCLLLFFYFGHGGIVDSEQHISSNRFEVILPVSKIYEATHSNQGLSLLFFSCCRSLAAECKRSIARTAYHLPVNAAEFYVTQNFFMYVGTIARYLLVVGVIVSTRVNYVLTSHNFWLRIRK